MPYIGNTVQNQGFAPAIDYFSGNGVTVTFTLSRNIASVAQVICAIDNVIQNPSSAFTVSGNSITFTSAPLSGTNNIWVEYTSLITTYAAISQDPSVIGDLTASGGFLSTGDFGNSYIDGTIVDYVTGRARITTGPIDDMTFYHGGSYSRSAMMDLYYAGGAKIYGTTALTIPVGTTGERPTGATGMIRMNTTLGNPEWYSTTASNWIPFSDTAAYAVNFLVIAGGGGGGGNVFSYNAGAGGGGAGGYRTSAGTSGGGGSAESQIVLTGGTSYTVTVGAGGAGAPTQSAINGTSGSNSVLSTITSIGGGGGSMGSGSSSAALSGGSGGGGGGDTHPGGSGTSNQGYAGGSRVGSVNTYGGCGGGGAGAVGFANDAAAGSPGGAGVASSISGSSVTYAGGGGGGGYSATGGAGGSGGGGAGGNSSGSGGSNGTTNTGSGGGGNGGTTSSGPVAGNGGSGVVVISYLGSQRGTGGTVTSSGGYTIHTFTSSGTYIA